MLRTAVCSALAVLTLTAAAPAQTCYPQATASYSNFDHRGRNYEVMYRTCAREAWRVYRVTHDYGRANDLARHLRCDGFQARVEHCG